MIANVLQNHWFITLPCVTLGSQDKTSGPSAPASPLRVYIAQPIYQLEQTQTIFYRSLKSILNFHNGSFFQPLISDHTLALLLFFFQDEEIFYKRVLSIVNVQGSNVIERFELI